MTEPDAAAIQQGVATLIPFVGRTGVEVLAAERGHCRLRMPLAPNVNHVGTMYAGALFTLAELPGGILFLTSFDTSRFVPVVTDLQIRFRRPARTDVTVDVQLDDAEVDRIQRLAEGDGRAEYAWDCDLRDADGEVVAVTHNVYALLRTDAAG